MRTVRTVSVLVVLGLIAGALGAAVAQNEIIAAPDWNAIAWQIRSLPTVNALNFTADQLEKIIPVLKQINKQVEEAGKVPPVEAPVAKELVQLREGLLKGMLRQEDIDSPNTRKALMTLDAQWEKVFGALPAVQTLKTLLTDEQEALLEGAILTPVGLRHRPPVPPPPFMQPTGDLTRERAEKMLDKIRQTPQADYEQNRTQWANDLVARAVKREDPEFANKVAALVALFDGARKLTEDQFTAQREDLVKQIMPYTGGGEATPAPPPPPPPPFAGTTGHPNLRVLVDPQVISLLELKLTYLRPAPAR